jgi:hypothetical protein
MAISETTTKLLSVLELAVKEVEHNRNQIAVLAELQNIPFQPELGTYEAFATSVAKLEDWASQPKPTYESLLSQRLEPTPDLARLVATLCRWRLVSNTNQPILSDGEFVLYAYKPTEALLPMATEALAEHWDIRDLPEADPDGKHWTQVTMRALAGFEERHPANVVTHKVTLTHGGEDGLPGPAVVPSHQIELLEDSTDPMSAFEGMIPDDGETLGQSIPLSSDDEPNMAIPDIEQLAIESGVEPGLMWNALCGGERAIAPRSLVETAIAEVKAKLEEASKG